MTTDALNILDWLSIQTRPGGEMCSSFKPMMMELKMDRAKVRRLCRLLHRRGMAEFHSGLCDDEGHFRGSGYCISDAGVEFLRERERAS
jgi:hypothetical protein